MSAASWDRWVKVLLADPCPYCDERAETLDHVVPRSHGGGNYRSNVVGACARCNHSKANASLLRWLLAKRRVADGEVGRR